MIEGRTTTIRVSGLAIFLYRPPSVQSYKHEYICGRAEKSGLASSLLRVSEAGETEDFFFLFWGRGLGVGVLIVVF